MLGFLTGRLALPVIAGLGVAVAGAASGYWVRGFVDRPAIAEAKEATAAALQAAAQAEGRLTAERAQAALAAAEANRLALQREESMQADLARARQAVASADTARRRSSQTLLESLRNAPQTDASKLSVAASAFYAGMRERQSAAVAGADADPNSPPSPP